MKTQQTYIFSTFVFILISFSNAQKEDKIENIYNNGKIYYKITKDAGMVIKGKLLYKLKKHRVIKNIRLMLK